MTPVIVESPYGNKDPSVVDRNVRYLVRCLRDAIKRGESPYASHGLIAALDVLDDNDPDQRAKSIGCGEVWRVFAERCVVYQDYGISEGMNHGIINSRAAGLVVEFREIGKNDPATEKAEAAADLLVLEALNCFSIFIGRRIDSVWRTDKERADLRAKQDAIKQLIAMYGR